MQYLSWIIRLLLVVLLAGFAFQNAEVVSLSYFGYVWRAPIILIILAFFIVGVFAALLAISPTLYKQKREVAALNRALKKNAKDQAAQAQGFTDSPDRFPSSNR